MNKRGASQDLQRYWQLIDLLILQNNLVGQTASEVNSDLSFEISDLNFPHIHVHVTPQRSIPTSVLKSVTSITLISMCMLPLRGQF